MTRDDVIAVLKSRESDLRARGVSHAALFGSVARGEARPDSDVDILVDLDPAIVATIYDYAGVKAFVTELFAGGVDVIDRAAMKPRVLRSAGADAIYVF
jgi:predicted nucleotidyltransferase